MSAVRAGVAREVRRLPSGATLLLEPRADAATAAAVWRIEVGSRDEPGRIAGVSHALEHLAFKGFGAWDAAALNRRLDELGARVNAYTAEDRTAVYGSALPERLDALLELLGGMLRPSLRPADVEVERRVILEEIAMAEDDPESRAADLAAAFAFAGHPMGRTILGSAERVAELTAEDLRGWARDRWTADRLTVAVAGRFDAEAVAERVERAASALKVGPVVPSREMRTAPAWRSGARRSDDDRFQRVYGAALAPGVARDDPERIAAALLGRVLGEPGHGTLHWTLVDPGLADQAGVEHDPGDGVGSFGGWFETGPGREDEVAERFLAELRTAQEGPVDGDAWRRAARTLATDLALQAETPMGRAMELVDAWAERGEVDVPDVAIERVLATAPDAGEALLARRPFDDVAWVVLGPRRRGGRSA